MNSSLHRMDLVLLSRLGLSVLSALREIRAPKPWNLPTISMAPRHYDILISVSLGMCHFAQKVESRVSLMKPFLTCSTLLCKGPEAEDNRNADHNFTGDHLPSMKS